MKAPGRAWLLLVPVLALAACFKSVDVIDLSDAGIKARIQTELQAQPDLDLKYVTIDVNDQVVTVSGMVNSFAEKQLISRIIRRTRGVEQLMLNVVTQE